MQLRQGQAKKSPLKDGKYAVENTHIFYAYVLASESKGAIRCFSSHKVFAKSFPPVKKIEDKWGEVDCGEGYVVLPNKTRKNLHSDNTVLHCIAPEIISIFERSFNIFLKCHSLLSSLCKSEWGTACSVEYSSIIFNLENTFITFYSPEKKPGKY